MSESKTKHKLIYEEKKAAKLFLWIFYIFYILYDLFFYFIFPYLFDYGATNKYQEGLGLWIYLFIFGLIPVAVFHFKKGNPYRIKYLYIYSFLLIDTVQNILVYAGTDKVFASGHIVEVVFILFSPIFVNKKYFYTVTIGMVLKYIFIGIVLQDAQVLVPMLIYIVLSAIALVILLRFDSYIQSLTKAHEQLRKKEKLAVIGQMAAGIGHEIRNPLSALKGFTQLQQERYPNTNEFYPIMIQEIDRINFIVNDLMTLGKPKALQFSQASMEEIIAYTISITQHMSERQGVLYQVEIADSIPLIDCDGQQLKQVFINLIKNAIESMPDGGKIEITVEAADDNKMSISIQDEGYGIDDTSILNLGEPFFTTKKDGTGLGLMVTNQIVRDHNGELKIESSLGNGTKVMVTLPISQIID